MHWKTKPKPEEIPPNPGQIMLRRKFAWLPTETNDDTIVWFERYWVVYEWMESAWSGDHIWHENSHHYNKPKPSDFPKQKTFYQEI